MVFRKIPQRFGYESVKGSARKFIISELPKTFNDRLYPKLQFRIPVKKFNVKVLGDENNPSGQLKSQTFSVSSLISDERIVLNYYRGAEVRQHAERLIHEALRYGDKHRPTMDLANFWLREKSLIHKLFKVLVPRYANHASSITALHYLGRDFDQLTRTKQSLTDPIYFHKRGQVIIELKGNSLPPIIRPKFEKAGLLSNILISGGLGKPSRSDQAHP